MGQTAPLVDRAVARSADKRASATESAQTPTGQATPTIDSMSKEEVGSPNKLALFATAIVNVRWATTAVALVLVGRSFFRPALLTLAIAIAMLAFTLYRTYRPLVYDGSPTGEARLLAEIALYGTAVSITGFWQSPFAIAMTGVLVVAGFAGGFWLALRIGAVAAIGVTAASALAEVGDLSRWSNERLEPSIQWITITMLSGLIAGYARRISGEATVRHSQTLDRLSELSEANTLLFNLHRLAQTLPASLELPEVIESSLTKLRGLLAYDRAVFLLVEDTGPAWTLARQYAMSVETKADCVVEPTDFPPPAKDAVSSAAVVLATGSPGFDRRSGCGIYAPLLTGNQLIGLIAIEADQPESYDERDRQTMQAAVQPIALAVDNARWFGRLRRTSIDEERTRIARELHDRIGQSLAALGFEADRLVRRHQLGADVGPELGQLQEGVRTAAAEIRYTLYDLRTDVDEDQNLADVLTEFADRVAERSGLTVTVEGSTSYRPPLAKEREIWRIAQEAVRNAERHANATTVAISWSCDASSAELQVTDDGRGLAPGGQARTDSYGVIGMRERAAAIDASIDIVSKPGEGTTVRCRIHLSQTPNTKGPK